MGKAIFPVDLSVFQARPAWQDNPAFVRRKACRKGHPFQGDNVIYRRQSDGRLSRLCRDCFNARCLAYQRRRRQEKAEARTYADV